MKIISCPLCKGQISVPPFSKGDVFANGKHVFCPDCGCMVWAPSEERLPPTAFPLAVSPEGRPWMTPRAM